MEKRKLGLSGLHVAPLCLGGNVFEWTADQKTSFAILDAFVDAGFDFIDTADVYSIWVPGHEGGESERVIGNWLAARGGRERLTIATLDIDQNNQTPYKLGVRGVPTVMLFKDGKVVAQKVGLPRKADLMAFLEDKIGAKVAEEKVTAKVTDDKVAARVA